MHELETNKDRLFIIGNGPSLKDVDLESLSPARSLGMNAAYRHWRVINWRPTYYACLDLVVGLSHLEEIATLIKERRIEKFLLRANLIEALGDIALDHRVINFDALHSAKAGLEGAATITTGSHAALWGALVGFQEIVLLGIDGNYKEIVDGAQRREGITLELTEARDNPNYYFDGYQSPGDRYCVPNPRPHLHVNAWNDAAHIIDRYQCTVYNANPKSEVRYFPFIDLQALLLNDTIALLPDDVLPVKPLPSAVKEAPISDRRARLTQFLNSQGRWCALLFVALSTILLGATFAKGFSIDTLIWMIVLGLLYAVILFQLFQQFTLAKVAIDSDTRISVLEIQMQEQKRQETIRTRDEIQNSD